MTQHRQQLHAHGSGATAAATAAKRTSHGNNEATGKLRQVDIGRHDPGSQAATSDHIGGYNLGANVVGHHGAG